MPCFHCDSTSSHEYKWNSTSCPEGVPRKKKGISTANAAAAIVRNGDHKRLLRAGMITLCGPRDSKSREREPPVGPICAFSASFAPEHSRRDPLRCSYM